jgi:hypothetical protein
LIIASINEIPGFGFAEALPNDNGRQQRVGILELAPANALRLQRVMSLGEQLVYSGPVWVDDHWSAESFPISLSDDRNARELLTRVEFTEQR